MRRTSQPVRTLQRRLRVHLGEKKNCPCIRCEAADEIDKLQMELWEAYEQITMLIAGSYHAHDDNTPESWAEIADGLPEQLKRSETN